MLDVSETAEPVIDIWPYVSELVNDKIVLRYVLEQNLVEKVYRNIDYTYEHILLPTNDQNIFIVLVVNHISPSIIGHYKLDSSNEYGL